MILFIDTAGIPSRTALADYNTREVIAQRTWEKPHSQSEKTLGYIDRLLKEEGKKVGDIKAVVANQGPVDSKGEEASFTGLKVGIALANTFFLVLKIPVFGVSLKGKNFQEVLKRVNLSDKENGFVSPIYPKEPNIDIKDR